MMQQNKPSKPFPNEEFVLWVIEEEFKRRGYDPAPLLHHDLVLEHPEGRRWKIEAKSASANPQVDMNTVLGQIIRRMDNPQSFYGVAFPKGFGYEERFQEVSDWVKQRLNLYLFIVREDGFLEEPPDAPI